jgi:hypothetical protein
MGGTRRSAWKQALGTILWWCELRFWRLPEPRRFSREQFAAWIAEDEADMRRFKEGE